MNFLFDLYGTLADIKTDEELQSLWYGFAWLLGESDVQGVKNEYLEICRKHADARAHKFVEFDLLHVFEEMLENRGASKSKARELAREFRLLSRQNLRLFPCIVDILNPKGYNCSVISSLFLKTTFNINRRLKEKILNGKYYSMVDR